MPNRPDTRHTIAKNIAWLMEVHGDVQTALAKKSGVSQKTISNILNPDTSGKDTAEIRTVDLIARAYGLNGWLLLNPNMPHDMAVCRKLGALIENYGQADDEGRTAIDRIAEYQASYPKK